MKKKIGKKIGVLYNIEEREYKEGEKNSTTIDGNNNYKKNK